MNSKEVAEIRRRFRYGKSNASSVRGVFVGEDGEIVSEFHQYLQDLPEDEVNLIYAISRKTLTGGIGKNLIDIAFTNEQVMHGEEFKLLNTLREQELKDDATVHLFFERAIASIEMDSAYLLMLAFDSYDVFAKNENGEKEEQSSEIFNYFVCSVCPIKTVKDTLSFYPYENRFRRISADTAVEAPQFGFMFPAFDDRGSNIYGALLFTRDITDNHEPFADAIFHAPVPMPAYEQKTNFNTILAESLQADCDIKVVKGIQREIREQLQERKEAKTVEPFTLNKREACELLAVAGAEEKHVEAFEQKFDEVFGEGTTITPTNLVEATKLEVKAPGIDIKVDAEHADCVTTRVIDGVKYVLVRADDDVEVNGVAVKIK